MRHWFLLWAALGLLACGNKDECGAQSDCDDQNQCTDDACVAGACQNTDANIDDNDACTVDACDPVNGVSHDPIAGIDDQNVCTDDACDPATGNVTHDPINIDDNDACTEDACDPITGVTHDPVPGIDDGDACTDDVCNSNNGVITHDPVDIDDNNDCTIDDCDPANGVTHDPIDVDDNNACTEDACDPIAGITHDPIAGIDDGIDCTDDVCNIITGQITHTADDNLCADSDGATCSTPVCDENVGCVEQENDTLCNDSQACTTADICDPTNAASDPVTGCAFTINNTICSDGVDCTDDVCAPFAGCDSTANNNNCQAGEFCDPTLDCQGVSNVLAQGVITEFVAIDLIGNIGEAIELHNPGTEGDLSGGTLTNTAGQSAVIRHPSGQGPVIIPAGAFVFGVPNRPGNISPGAAFIYGDPGTDFTLNDAGDTITIRNSDNVILDVVDFAGKFTTNPDVLVPQGNFPGVSFFSTQLEPLQTNTTANDNGNNWCISFGFFNSLGAANFTCSASATLINELLYDGALGANGADPSKDFIELVGPGGADLSNVRVRGVDGSGADAGTVGAPDIRIGDLLPGARMPVDGIFVIADNTNGDNVVVPANARDLQASFLPNNGDDSIQLLLDDGNGALDLLDVLGYAADGVLDDIDDDTDLFPTFEGTPALDANDGVSLARNLDNDDTDDNSVDFFADPSPSPGVQNQPVNTEITSVFPDDGLATSTTLVILTGTDLAANAAITFAGVSIPNNACDFSGNPTVIRCNIPPGTVSRGDIVYTNTIDRGGSSETLTNGWTYTGVVNETGQGIEADFCDLQFPFATTAAVNQPSPLIFGQIFEAGLTDVTSGAAAPNILAELGFGAFNTDPTVNASWVFSSAQFNVETGFNNNNDEYKGSLIIPVAGTFSYTYRFSLDGGLNFTYCDQGPDAGGDGGSGSNGGLTFEPGALGTITVN